jgi:hypothetical protein
VAKFFNEVLEYSGLSPIDYGGIKAPQPMAPAMPTATLSVNQPQT